jgi:chromate transport protein ChrA
MSRFARREDLPFGVVVVALGFILNALLFALAITDIYGTSRAIVQLTAGTPLLRPVYIGVLAVEILAALLLLRRHPAGWVLAMLLICVSLAFLLATWYLGSPEYLRMAIFAAMALYLNQREVRTAFAWHPKENADAPAAVDEEGAGAG